MNDDIIGLLPYVPQLILGIMIVMGLVTLYYTYHLFVYGWSVVPRWRRWMEARHAKVAKNGFQVDWTLLTQLEGMEAPLHKLINQALGDCLAERPATLGERVVERCVQPLDGELSFLRFVSMCATPMALVATAAGLAHYIHDLQPDSPTASLAEAFLLMIPGIGLLFLSQIAIQLGGQKCNKEAWALGDTVASIAFFREKERKEDA